MTRIGTTLLIVMIIFNSTVAIMAGTGLSEDLGVELAPGVQKNVDNAISQAKSGFSPGGGFGETLFGLFAAAMSTVSLLLQSIFAFPTMLSNIGFPEEVVIPLFAPVYIIILFEIIYAATGRDLV